MLRASILSVALVTAAMSSPVAGQNNNNKPAAATTRTPPAARAATVPAAPAAQAAPAQAAPAAPAARPARQQCEQTPARQTRRSIMGGVLGGLAGGLLGNVGGVGGIIASAIPTEVLGEALLNLLDCREQQQAVTATGEAIRGGEGTTVNWTSESRPNVRGSSTASGGEQLPDGTHCMTVTDVVIVDGQETRAPKRMCRRPGQRGYARA